MGNLIRINQDDADAAKEFADRVAMGEITHGVACYRTHDGYLRYIIINPDHLTYILGLMERTKIDLIQDAKYNDLI